jgi:hypothetical protein
MTSSDLQEKPATPFLKPTRYGKGENRTLQTQTALSIPLLAIQPALRCREKA